MLSPLSGSWRTTGHRPDTLRWSLRRKPLIGRRIFLGSEQRGFVAQGMPTSEVFCQHRSLNEESTHETAFLRPGRLRNRLRPGLRVACVGSGGWSGTRCGCSGYANLSSFSRLILGGGRRHRTGLLRISL